MNTFKRLTRRIKTTTLNVCLINCILCLHPDELLFLIKTMYRTMTYVFVKLFREIIKTLNCVTL